MGSISESVGWKSRMSLPTKDPYSLELHWQGPFAWPGIELKDLPDLLDDEQVSARCGVYLWAVEHPGGYLIYTAGITRRPFGKRFREHTRAYRSGVYTVFESESLKNGIRKIVWPGFWFKKRSVEMQYEYEAHAEEISTAVKDLLTSYRIFVAPLSPAARILERIEAAIMNNLYTADGPASAVPDRGMALAPRRRDESLIRVQSISSVVLHGLPSEFDA
jgi:hypothetical protein